MLNVVWELLGKPQGLKVKYVDICTDVAKSVTGKDSSTLVWIKVEAPNYTSSHCCHHCHEFVVKTNASFRWKCLWWNGVCVVCAQTCPVLCDHMDCSPSGSSVHGILQARILEWVAIPFFRGSSWPRDLSRVFHIAGRFFTIWATREVVKTINFIQSWSLSMPLFNVLLYKALLLHTEV